MDLIMFHSGCSLPGYLECTFKQIRLFNPEITIHFLTDKEYMQDTLFAEFNITAVDKDDYYSNKIERIEALYERKPNDFWTITTTRLFYFENYIREKKLVDVFHFENDVLIYFNIEDYYYCFKIFDRLAITTGGPDKCMTGFLYIRNAESLELMNDFFIDALRTYGKQGTMKIYGLDMINEMTLMRAYQIEKGSLYLAKLPTIPFGDESRFYKLFKSIFDPASWGQYIGGTLGEGPGAKPEDHYIGQLLIANPSYDVIWKLDEQGRKFPYFKYDNNEVKINNLHIHSKNLSKYVSYR